MRGDMYVKIISKIPTTQSDETARRHSSEHTLYFGFEKYGICEQIRSRFDICFFLSQATFTLTAAEAASVSGAKV